MAACLTGSAALRSEGKPRVRVPNANAGPNTSRDSSPESNHLICASLIELGATRMPPRALRYCSRAVRDEAVRTNAIQARRMARRDPKRAHASPWQTIFFYGLAWKTLLLVLAACSPGPGYDTSTDLFFPEVDREQSTLHTLSQRLLTRLTRWDAIYYVNLAQRSYRFEQEWAFGWGWTRTIAALSTGLSHLGFHNGLPLAALLGIVVAHLSHVLSAFVLYRLTKTLFPQPEYEGFGLVSALLHVVSPAGLFLSAPYAESSCALLTFAGALLFARSLASSGISDAATRDALVVLSGVALGFATTLRSNAILGGLLLLEEAFRVLLQLRHGFSISVLRRLAATGLGGICVGLGFSLPQYLAYSEYCSGRPASRSPAWCEKTIPSIYTFVQSHYWNCGLFRYWTFSNLPLFLLAAPMFTLMTVSAIWAMWTKGKEKERAGARKHLKASLGWTDGTIGFQVIRNLAVAQLVLVLLTLTTAHVQIITRLSSSYPIWTWYVAHLLRSKSWLAGQCIVPFLLVYALIQGGLFASFLPPA